MPFIPHTEDDVRAMLASIGVDSIDALFDEIPADLRAENLRGVPEGLGEMQMARLMAERAESDGTYLNFIGAGAYEHHIPAAVWQLATRGEFYSSYTPYQAEASQGTLQLIYEYQTMMASLTGLDVTNASLYDGASALAEAVLMAVRAHKGARRVAIPRTVHPRWREVVRAIVRNQDIELTELSFDAEEGRLPSDALAAVRCDEHAALIIPQPNFFGTLELVDALTDSAHAQGLLVIAAVNPTAMSLLKPPGAWGEKGADIAVGDGQPLGIPLSGGGPYFGFLACRQSLVRQMPGRIVGRTVDVDGRDGYTLTLQAREQHIRRSKATSNICTNQGLMVTAATIYMALLGPHGLREAARASHVNTMRLLTQLTAIPGVERAFETPVFHECVVTLNKPVDVVLQGLRAEGILGGFHLTPHYPELNDALLVCATETKTAADIGRYAGTLQRVMTKRGAQSRRGTRRAATKS
jgi:glycine dehydrogenase subunit 1